MEEDIQNYSPTVMFRGTPCISNKIHRMTKFSQSRIWENIWLQLSVLGIEDVLIKQNLVRGNLKKT